MIVLLCNGVVIRFNRGVIVEKSPSIRNRKPIKYLYYKILFPIILVVLIVLSSVFLTFYLYPDYIFYIRNTKELSDYHKTENQALLLEKQKRIHYLNDEIDKIDGNLSLPENMEYDKQLELRNILVNERNELWNIK